jgi:alpha-amylase
MLKRFLIVLSLTLSLSVMLSAQDATQEPDAAESTAWGKTVWYELFVRSFYDSDGDGIGDLQGVIQKLDYLNDGDPSTTTDLGVTGIWLMPITSAASYHGYDTLDYYAIEPDYGTLDDFKELLTEAHQRGIRVIMDLVLNHTGSGSEWFQKSIKGDPTYADWYVWSDTDLKTKGPWGQDVWYQKGDRYYYAIFWSEMPDLNYDNPDVVQEAFNIADFWIGMGVDGFRLDAVKYVVEQEINGRRVLEDAPANRTFLANFRTYVHRLNPDAYVVGEIWDSSAVISRYMNDESVDEAFEFDLSTAMLNAARATTKRDLERLQKSLQNKYGTQIALFLTNHDQTRLMTVLKGSVDRNKVAASLLLTLPGTPFLYYGEEIGMIGDKPDERIRTPMQWDSTITGGFTTRRPWEALQNGYRQVNVGDETDDPESLLSHYRSLIQLRNTHPALQGAGMIVMDKSHPFVYAYLRYEGDDKLLVVINLDDEPVEKYSLTLNEGPLAGVTEANVIFGDLEAPPVPTITEAGGFSEYVPWPSLPPFSTTIVELK